MAGAGRVVGAPGPRPASDTIFQYHKRAAARRRPAPVAPPTGRLAPTAPPQGIGSHGTGTIFWYHLARRRRNASPTDRNAPEHAGSSATPRTAWPSAASEAPSGAAGRRAAPCAPRTPTRRSPAEGGSSRRSRPTSKRKRAQRAAGAGPAPRAAQATATEPATPPARAGSAASRPR